MSMQRINLLPESHRRTLVRTYYYHLGVVVFTVITSLVLVAAVLLVPTYLYLTQTRAIKEAELAELEALQPAPSEKGIAERLTILLGNVAAITALTNTSPLSTTLRAALAVSRDDITLFNINYTIATGGRPSTLLLSGTARTRDALHRYQTALEEAPFSRSATVPVSSYAKDIEVPFTVTITLAP